MPKTVLIAPASFKGTLSASEAARIIADELQHCNNLTLQQCPIADGGDDTLSVLAYTDPQFKWVHTTVTGPLPEQQLNASYLIHSEKQLAVVEAAQAHGLVHLPEGVRAPMRATSYGVGELIAHVCRHGDIRTLIVTLGGSASTDGGIGALQALGYNFMNAQTTLPSPLSAQHLQQIESIMPPADSPINDVNILIATDVTSPLLGEHGSAHVFSPQKGASPEQVLLLEQGLSHLATTVTQCLGTSHQTLKGAGAAGGLGFGLSQLPHSSFVSGAQWVASQLNLAQQIDQSHLIITGEGQFDHQSLSGKGTGSILTQCGEKPVVIIGGQVEAGLSMPPHVHAISLVNEHYSLEEALNNPETALRAATQQASVLLNDLLYS